MGRGADFCIGLLAALAVAAQASATPLEPTPVSSPDGWTIRRAEQPHVCVASGPADGGARLSLIADGPGFDLNAEAPDFPRDGGSYTAATAFDGGPPATGTIHGVNGLVSLSLGRGEPARRAVSASTVAITVNGRTHRFSLRNAAAALDAVARCAGEPTLAEQPEAERQPIAGAGDWMLMVTMPGAPGRACAARVEGAEIDTLLLLNDVGDLLLIGGHKDFAMGAGQVPMSLSIDGAPPLILNANTLGNLIITEVKQPPVVERLRRAKAIDWGIPAGHVRGEVAGLGVALDAMKACKAQRG